MSPDNVEESGSGDSSNKHRRGKIGRSRKKRRHCEYLSRWRTGDSDDEEDIELYQWSKSRGLTSRSLPASSPQQASKSALAPMRMKVQSELSESRSATVQRTQRSSSDGVRRVPSASDTSIMQEAIFQAQLCDSIADKQAFVSQSTEIKPTTDQKNVPEKQTSPATHKQITVHLSRMKKEKEQMNSTGKCKDCCSLPCIEKSPAACSCQEHNRSQLSANNEGMKGTLHSKKNSSLRKGSAASYSTSDTLHKKKWSANIESNILRLYESAPAPASSLVCSWTSPSVASKESDISSTPDVAQVVDKKIEQAEHTPDYVQVLTKMFRTRMQIRKDREQQIENDMKDVWQTKKLILSEKNDFRSETNAEVLSSASPNAITPTLVSLAQLRHLSNDVRTTSYESEPRIKKGRSSAPNPSQVAHAIRVPFQHVAASDDHDPAQVTSPAMQQFKPRKFSSKHLGGVTGNGILGSSLTQEGERILKSLAVRLDKEARSEHTPCFKLCASGDASKLQKPTPSNLSGHDVALDSSSVQILAKEARQCLLSNSRSKYGDNNREIDLIRTTGTGILTRVVTSNACHTKDGQVRWPASVGTLYFRPPARSYSTESIQKA